MENDYIYWVKRKCDMAEHSRLNRFHWLTLLFICFFGLVGCIATDHSTIDESSIVITQGIVRDDYAVIHIDADATGLEGYDTVLPDKETGFHHRRHDFPQDL